MITYHQLMLTWMIIGISLAFINVFVILTDTQKCCKCNHWKMHCQMTRGYLGTSWDVRHVEFRWICRTCLGLEKL